MHEWEVSLKAVGSSPVVTVPQNGLDDEPKSAKYLRIALKNTPSKCGIFELNPAPREGASGSVIYLQPGQLGLTYDESVKATASPATRWSYRRSQLRTTNGYLILATLVLALTSAFIDGSLALPKLGVQHFFFDSEALGAFGAISWFCKMLTALLAFLLALWFKK